MNEYIRKKYAWRAAILNNTDNLVAHYSKKNFNQMSLFPISEDKTFELTKQENINYIDIAKKEAEVLGFCLTYDPFEKYILQKLLYCNATISSVLNTTENDNNLIFISKVDEIQYKKSQYGNNYAKITFSDNNSSISMYLFGEMYKKHIANIICGYFYLIKASYDKNTQRTNIISIKDVETVDLKSIISTIKIHLTENIEDVIYVKRYINNMFGGNSYNIVFVFNDEEFKNPFKINFTEEFYLDIKSHINKLEIIKTTKKI